MISDKDLAHLRHQTEFNALADNKPAGEWRKLADALTELEERRAKDQEQASG